MSDELLRRPGAKCVYQFQPDEKLAWLPGGRCLIVHPERQPKLMAADGTVREISYREAAGLVVDPRTLVIP